MGSRYQADIPENIHTLVAQIATIASSDEATIPCFRMPVAGKVLSIYYTLNASQDSVETDYKTISIINKGVAAAGSTEVASLVYTAVHAAYVPAALTLSSTAADLAFTAGQVLAFNAANSGDGAALGAGYLTVNYQMT